MKAESSAINVDSIISIEWSSLQSLAIDLISSRCPGRFVSTRMAPAVEFLLFSQLINTDNKRL